MNNTLENRLRAASNKAHSLGQKALKRTLSSILSLGMVAGLAAPQVTFSQETTLVAEKEKVKKPTGTILRPNSKPIPIPSHNVELVAANGRKIYATVLGFEGGVKIKTADHKEILLKWEKLNWETVAKLTGQELSYEKVGMDGQWLPSGPPKCSRCK